MNSHRIYIIGASGTGKTTLAKAIAARLSIPHFDSDDYFHYPSDPPFQKQRSPEERASLLLSDLSRHFSWVLSGGAGTWQPAVGTNTLPLHESYISGFPSRLCLDKPLTTDEQLTLVLNALKI